MRLGVEGNRADIFALKAARANAALAKRNTLGEDDLVAAVAFVLAPRATTYWAAPQEAREEKDPSASERPSDGNCTETLETDYDFLGGPIEDRIIQAIDARVPNDLLSAAILTGRSSGRGGRSKASTDKRGRYSRSTPRHVGEGKVAVDATLRAAAPYQQWRRLQDNSRASRRVQNEALKRSGAKLRANRRVEIDPTDLRFKQFRQRSGVLFIFAVDASGSMAVNRMAQAKGALTRLLEQAYLHRDKVALISFRGKGAEVLLAPTRSVELAKRLVDALPAGGGTPLAAGLVKALELAQLARLRGMCRAMLVLFTDGRANVRFREIHAKERASTIAEVEQLGRLLGSDGINVVLVDTKSKFVSGGEARVLAETLNARYFYLGRSDISATYAAITSMTGDRSISKRETAGRRR
jgi:magnesium chelatase subunit D